MKRLRWNLPERTVPEHPIRDSAIIYAVLAVLVLVVAVATGGSFVRVLVATMLAYAASMAWAWVRWRRRLREERRP